jgi:phenylalanyl-tRNA synthetase beta chain
MQLPFSWLKSLFPHDLNSHKIEDILTKAGIEVDLVEKYSPPFSGVIVAKVLSVTPHPDATKLQVAQVFDGQITYQVVCGAKNCRKDLITAFAKPGAVLGETNPFTIQEKPLRGVHSQGMLCSADELGLSSVEEEGILEFGEAFPIGTDLKAALGDEIFHISITPNLGHTLSVLGIARELKAFLNLPYNISHPKIELVKDVKKLNISPKSGECVSYNAYALKNISLVETPFIMKHRLRLAGFNTKNLLVDVLNYVMFERGQPMHAFDKSKLTSEDLLIDNLKEVKSFEALNGKTYTAPANTLAILSNDKIAAIAGVMGSMDSACDEHTNTAILESALFTSSSVRRSIKSLDLRSDSASRFEKGVDPEAVQLALDYATSLICSLTGAEVSGYFQYNTAKPVKEMVLRVDRCNKLLGTSLTQGEMKQMLESLEMKVSLSSQDKLHVLRPSYRNDINIEEDLIEEIGRLYGLDHLKGSLSYQATTMLDHPLYTFEKPVKKALFAQGLQEVLTCDLLSKDLAVTFKLDRLQNLEPICVLHPRSQDQCTLRMSLLASMIPVVKKNISCKEDNLSIFEVGKTHAKLADKYLETMQAGILLTGLASPYHFDPKSRLVDFYDLKGIVEGFLDDVGVNSYEYKTSHDPVFHPHQQLSIFCQGELICKFGQVHPLVLKKYDIESAIFYAELSLPELLKHQKTIYPASLPPTQPFIERDWTVPLALSKGYNDLLTHVYENLPEHFESICLLSIYIQPDIKNVTVRIRYRHKEKSLESNYIDQIHQKFTSDVAKKL